MRIEDARHAPLVIEQRVGGTDGKTEIRSLEDGGAAVIWIMARVIDEPVRGIPVRPERKRPLFRQGILRRRKRGGASDPRQPGAIGLDQPESAAGPQGSCVADPKIDDAPFRPAKQRLEECSVKVEPDMAPLSCGGGPMSDRARVS
jgi:hypothetical protein